MQQAFAMRKLPSFVVEFFLPHCFSTRLNRTFSSTTEVCLLVFCYFCFHINTKSIVKFGLALFPPASALRLPSCVLQVIIPSTCLTKLFFLLSSKLLCVFNTLWHVHICVCVCAHSYITLMYFAFLTLSQRLPFIAFMNYVYNISLFAHLLLPFVGISSVCLFAFVACLPLYILSVFLLSLTCGCFTVALS